MNLEASQKNWDQLAKEDAFWAILTDPFKKHGRWQPEEFFQTGVAEINKVMEDLARQGLTPGKDRALDFGCGAGRLSQALAAWFKEVHGVDVSSSMIELANRFNKQPDRCHYHLNADGHLRRFPDGHFDFLYSVITLQHIEPQFQKQYLREFFRVLKPGGIAVFQLLTAIGWRQLVPDFAVSLVRKLKHGGKAFIPMFGLNERAVSQLLEQGNAQVLNLERTPDSSGRWGILRYVAKRSQGHS